MATTSASNENEPLDLRITISFCEKPNADRCEIMLEFIKARGNICKQLLCASDTNKSSTQAEVSNEYAMIILLRTRHWKNRKSCFDVLKTHFIGRNGQTLNDITSVVVTECDQTDKKLLEQSDCSRIVSTNAEIGRQGASQSNLET